VFFQLVVIINLRSLRTHSPSHSLALISRFNRKLQCHTNSGVKWKYYNVGSSNRHRNCRNSSNDSKKECAIDAEIKARVMCVIKKFGNEKPFEARSQLSRSALNVMSSHVRKSLCAKWIVAREIEIGRIRKCTAIN
jgi:hypothetical protein